MCQYADAPMCQYANVPIDLLRAVSKMLGSCFFNGNSFFQNTLRLDEWAIGLIPEITIHP